MAEYIERDKLLDDFELCNKQNPRWTPQRVKSLLVRAPAADVVEVVRCKDCKHYKPPKVSAHFINHTPYCTRVVTMKVKPDDFCSYGERRE